MGVPFVLVVLSFGHLVFHSLLFCHSVYRDTVRKIKPVFTVANLHLSPIYLPQSDSILWPGIDSAEAEQLSEILLTQEAGLVCQEEFQTAMAANMGHVSSQLQDLLGQITGLGVAAETPTTTSAPETSMHTGGATCKLAPPTPYTGEPGLCKTFSD